MSRMEIRLPEWLKLRAIARAYQMGISLSTYLRDLILGENPSRVEVKKIPLIKSLHAKRH